MRRVYALEIHAGDESDRVRTLFSGEASGVRAVRFDEFGARMLAELAPSSVLAPLFSARFDCVDVANCLARAAYPGRFCVIAEALPDKAMVERELTRQFPALDLHVVTHGEVLSELRPIPRRATG